MARTRADVMRRLAKALPPIVIISNLHRLADGQVVEEIIVAAERAAWEADPRSTAHEWAVHESPVVPGRILASRLVS